MEINRLNQDELGYEMTIRGLPVGKVDDMRTHLRTMLKAEKAGKSVIISPYPYSFEQDFVALSAKIEEIKGLLDTMDPANNPSEYTKLLTKIEWALSRYERMVTTTEAEKKQKVGVRVELLLAFGHLRSKVDGEEEDEEYSDAMEAMSIPAAVLTAPRTRALLHKWEIKFSGEQSQSLNSFLERVNELAEARGITRSQLFRSALDLFTGKALIWYRANKGNFNSWIELVRELKKEFLAPDYDDRLLEEIKKRTQGKDESIGLYVAMVTNMFGRLTDPLTEEQQIKMLKRNIAPFYQAQLGLTATTTIQELVELGRRFESVRSSVEAFIPPPSKRHTHLLESDLAYAAAEYN